MKTCSRSRRWYPRDRRVAWLTDRANAIQGLAGAAIFVPLVLVAPVQVLLLLGASALTLLLPAYGWRVDEDGLHLLRVGVVAPSLRRSTLFPWDCIHGVQLDARELRIATSDRTIRVSALVPGIREMAAELRSGLGLEDQPTKREVTPTLIADWLGIEPEGSLPCSARPMVRFGIVAYLAACAAFGVVAAVVQPLEPAIRWVVGSFGAFIGLTAWLVWRCTSSTVTSHGIQNADRVVPWSAVNGVERAGVVGWTLWTDHGFVYVWGRNGRYVAQAVEKMLQARQSGAILPRMTDVPDHAISRAESAEVSAERGISPADGEDG